MKDVSVNLGPVQQTLLIPLLGRAHETHRGGLINDPKAVEIVERLDYDLDQWKGTRSLIGASIRTRMFDEDVATFLEAHSEGIVVELGCGLNTRYERLDNGRARWFEIDLPDVMALRRQFFNDDERRRMLSASVLDTDWIDAVAAETEGPWCFVSEAVVIYLDKPQVREVVERLAARFPGSWFLTDTTSTLMVETQGRHDAMSKLGKDSWFRWKCDEPATLAAWGLRLVHSRTFLDTSPAVVAGMPWTFRAVMRWVPWLVRRKAEGYRINRFELGPPAGGWPVSAAAR